MLTMYSTSWCGYCHRLGSQLDRENIAYEVVDIETDPAAAEYVRGVNGGNQTVPTLRFADGSALSGLPLVSFVVAPALGVVALELRELFARLWDWRHLGTVTSALVLLPLVMSSVERYDPPIDYEQVRRLQNEVRAGTTSGASVSSSLAWPELFTALTGSRAARASEAPDEP